MIGRTTSVGGECSKKFVQQGRSPFDARSVLSVREHGKRARTPLAAFFNIPTMAATLMACRWYQASTSPNLSLQRRGTRCREGTTDWGLTLENPEGPEIFTCDSSRITLHASRIQVAPDLMVVLGFANLNEGRFCGFTVVHDFRAAGVESAAGGRVEGTRDVT